MSPQKQLAWWHLTMARMLGNCMEGRVHMEAFAKFGLAYVPELANNETWWQYSEFNMMAHELAKNELPQYDIEIVSRTEK